MLSILDLAVSILMVCCIFFRSSIDCSLGSILALWHLIESTCCLVNNFEATYCCGASVFSLGKPDRLVLQLGSRAHVVHSRAVLPDQKVGEGEFRSKLRVPGLHTPQKPQLFAWSKWIWICTLSWGQCTACGWLFAISARDVISRLHPWTLSLQYWSL